MPKFLENRTPRILGSPAAAAQISSHVPSLEPSLTKTISNGIPAASRIEGITFAVLNRVASSLYAGSTTERRPERCFAVVAEFSRMRLHHDCHSSGNDLDRRVLILTAELTVYRPVHGLIRPEADMTRLEHLDVLVIYPALAQRLQDAVQ